LKACDLASAAFVARLPPLPYPFRIGAALGIAFLKALPAFGIIAINVPKRPAPSFIPSLIEQPQNAASDRTVSYKQRDHVQRLDDPIFLLV